MGNPASVGNNWSFFFRPVLVPILMVSRLYVAIYQSWQTGTFRNYGERSMSGHETISLSGIYNSLYIHLSALQYNRSYRREIIDLDRSS